MTAKFERSPPLFARGSSWFENVPTGWAVTRLRHVLRRRTARNRPDLPLLSVIRDRGVILRDTTNLDENHNYIPDDLSNYKVVRTGQFAMNKMKAWQGSYGVSRLDGIVSPAYFVFDVFGVDVSFFHVAIRSLAYVQAFTQASDGVRIGQWDLAEARMREIPFLVPPSVEQRGIARFLDHADRRIQRYIRAKQKLIALLEEQKQAIIHQAVTGQIDIQTGQPFPDYKSSGVECIGDIPKHWSVRLFKSLVKRIDQGISPQAESHLADGGAWGVLKAGCVNGGVFRQHEHKRLPSGFEFDAALAVAPGDVLVARASGSPRFVGSTGRVSTLQYNVILSDKIFRPAFSVELDANFMVLAMNGSYYREQVERAISGAEGLANNLPLSSLRVFLFAIPKFDEQRMIVRYVGTFSESLNKSIKQAKRRISLLQEYRSRLISDVVTGQLDVRESKAALQRWRSIGDPLHRNPGSCASTVRWRNDAIEARDGY